MEANLAVACTDSGPYVRGFSMSWPRAFAMVEFVGRRMVPRENQSGTVSWPPKAHLSQYCHNSSYLDSS
jgi:hypothetical protein